VTIRHDWIAQAKAQAPTHSEVTKAMFAASVAMGDLIKGAATPEDAVRLGVLADAMSMANRRLAAIEEAFQYKGKRH
jgi:hypothetical protein